MKNFLLVCLAVALSAASATAGPPKPSREILGLNLSMDKEEALERLKKIGKFERAEGGWQEVWKIRDPGYSHLIVGFGQDEKLNFITAVARKDKEAKLVSYAKAGDVAAARQTGDPKVKNFNYQWELAAAKGQPRAVVIAAGRDPKFLTTLSIKNLENAPGKEEKD